MPAAKQSAELRAALVPGHGLSLVIRSLGSSCQWRAAAAAAQLSPAPLHRLEECGADARAALWPGARAALLEKLLPHVPLPRGGVRGV